MRRIDLPDNWMDFDASACGTDVCLVRYGAFGDMLQAASVFPALKQQGLSITLNTTTRGAEVIRHDPHIDTLLVQRKDQVPNDRLKDYWNNLRKPFKRFINLSESIERSLLAIEGDRVFDWHSGFRDLVIGHVDYLEAVHTLSGVRNAKRMPFFYPTKKEARNAERFRNRLGGGNRVVMWSISGSSLHKVWPHMDMIFARLLVSYPDVKIITVGDSLCKIIEQPWGSERRVICKSGEWSIRETLAMLPFCDMIIGPETGVMNAASYLPIPKILLLSHSSPGNIGASWMDTAVLTPKGCECYPCHKLHYSWKTCRRNEQTGVADCATKIDPEEMWAQIVKVFS